MAACDDDAVGDDTEVFGVIRDACTERGLVGADVSFSSDTGEAASAISGGDGRYQIRITTRSPFGQLRAAREGYTADQRAVHFDRGSRNVDLSLVPSDGCPLR